MEWYVLRCDFVTSKIEKFNIFNSFRFLESIKKSYKKYEKYKDYEMFKEDIRHDLMFAYMSKVEFEILCSDLIGKTTSKIDVYTQVLPNLDILCRYIIKKKCKCKE